MKLEKTLLSKTILVVFASLLVIVFYKGMITPPSEGDSVDYHIPIARAVLTGQIFNPVNLNATKHARFYPANAESILSLFILFHLPMGLFNFLGILLLTFSALKVSKAFNMDVQNSIVFAVSIATLNIIIRWSDTQIIDIYLLSFFLLTLSYLEKPKKSFFYFIKLGICFGLLIGAKFSAPFIVISLLIIYFKKIFKYLNIKNIFAFIVFLIIAGGFWYIRNLILKQNPFYPQAFLFFPGLKKTILSVTVLTILIGPIRGVIGTINGFISEFMVWSFITPIVLFLNFGKIKKANLPVRLLVLGLLCFFVALQLPSATEIHIMTSSIRYFLPSLSCFLLLTFIYFVKIKKEILFYIAVIVNIIFLGFPQGYFPKLLIIAFPVALFIYFKGYDLLTGFIKKYI